MSNQNAILLINLKKYLVWIAIWKLIAMVSVWLPFDNPKPGSFKMEQEIWKEIPNYNGKYFISNSGKLKSYFHGEYILKYTWYNHYGYLVSRLFKNNKKKVVFIHRLIAQAFIPNPKNLPEVNHINAIKSDNRIENLEWCTHKENHIHASKLGISAKKLNKKQVRVIRKCNDLSQYELAKIFNISQSMICFIKNYKFRIYD